MRNLLEFQLKLKDEPSKPSEEDDGDNRAQLVDRVT